MIGRELEEGLIRTHHVEELQQKIKGPNLLNNLVNSPSFRRKFENWGTDNAEATTFVGKI